MWKYKAQKRANEENRIKGQEFNSRGLTILYRNYKINILQKKLLFIRNISQNW